jgi:hypothetical protein
MIRRKIKGYETEQKFQELCYYVAAPFLGYPTQLNRWIYPDIFDWDLNEFGHYEIPAWICFYTDPQRYLNLQQWQQFHSQINRALHIYGGSHYQIDHPAGEHFLWVIRRHINHRYNYYVPTDLEAPIHEVSRWYSTLEWEGKLREFREIELPDPSGNGHPPRKVIESLREVRPNLFESEGF